MSQTNYEAEEYAEWNRKCSRDHQHLIGPSRRKNLGTQRWVIRNNPIRGVQRKKEWKRVKKAYVTVDTTKSNLQFIAATEEEKREKGEESLFEKNNGWELANLERFEHQSSWIS